MSFEVIIDIARLTMYNRHPTITKIHLVHLPREYIEHIDHDCSLLHNLLSYRPQIRLRTGKLFLFISQPKHMLWYSKEPSQ